MVKGKKLTPDELVKHNEKLANRGVCYLSRIPPYMKPHALRKLLEGYGTDVLRLYLKPEDPAVRSRRLAAGGNKKASYTEGWVEFNDKRRAKRIAATLNNSPMGGGHRSFYAYDLWNIKYLHKFKWDHLTEKISEEARTRQDRMRSELSKSKIETNFYFKQVGQAKAIEAMARRRDKRQGEAPPAAGTESARDANMGGRPDSKKRPLDAGAGDAGGERDDGGLRAMKRSFKQRKPLPTNPSADGQVASRLLMRGVL